MSFDETACGGRATFTIGQKMHAEPPEITSDEVQDFAFCVGKTIQNYGTTEYLVNELIAVLTSDALITSHLVKLGIGKRLDVLESLVERRKQELEKHGHSAGDLFASARSAFQNRNKVAHNPFVVRARKSDGSQISAGIQVVRYHSTGKHQEWIDRAELERLTEASRKLAEQFNMLLARCNAVVHAVP